MKRNVILLVILVVSLAARAQDMKNFKLYSPTENADSALKVAVAEANRTGKHVFVQIGGNWCVWCARFHEFVTKDAQLDSMMKADFVVYHQNYSPENRNKEILARYGYPQRFGFPVFLILDGKGNLLHTQNSAYLELDKSYSKDKIMEFFRHWNKKAFDPAEYIRY